ELFGQQAPAGFRDDEADRNGRVVQCPEEPHRVGCAGRAGHGECDRQCAHGTTTSAFSAVDEPRTRTSRSVNTKNDVDTATFAWKNARSIFMRSSSVASPPTRRCSYTSSAAMTITPPA